jgi:hypothetical protein
MTRVKAGTRMSHLSVISKEVDSSWVTDHFNGILNTSQPDVGLNLTAEDDVNLLTETGVAILTESPPTDIEITSIGFVTDETESSNSTTGQFVP